MNTRPILYMLPLLFIACSNERKTTVTTVPYEDQAAGWSTSYPSSWRKMSEEEMGKLEDRGQVAMENAIEQEMELTHRNLLWLKKDDFNSFTSNVQPYDTAADGPYADNQRLVNQAIIDTYSSQGLQFDVSYGNEMIDSLEFTTMSTTLWSPDKKKVILNQVIYDRLMDGSYSLTLNINYNNDRDKEELMNVIRASKFKTRK